MADNEQIGNRLDIQKHISSEYDLKKRGIGIRATNVAGINRYGEPCHYARYTLEPEQMAV